MNYLRQLPEQSNEVIDPYIQVWNKGGDKIFQSPHQPSTVRPIFHATFNWIENEVLIVKKNSIVSLIEA